MADVKKPVTIESADMPMIIQGLELLAASRARAAKAETDAEVAYMLQRRVAVIEALLAKMRSFELEFCK